MEIIKNIALIFFVIALFVTWSVNPPASFSFASTGASGADPVPNADGYTLPDYINQDYGDAGYEYYMADSKNIPTDDLSNAGHSYYASDYSKYAEYNDVDSGYQYYKKSKKYQGEYDENEGYRLYREFDEYGYDGDLKF